MIPILICSHSKKFAEGLKEIFLSVINDAEIRISAGNEDGGLGSDFLDIREKISDAYSENGLIIFFDLGSSMMNCQMALDMMEEEERENIVLVDTPILESGIEILVMASTGSSLEDIRAYVRDYPIHKIDS